MRNRRGCVQWAIVAAVSLFALALVVLCPLAFLHTRRLDQARARYAAPTVFVTEPAPGLSVPAGSYVSVSATAIGDVPITRAELWVDGVLVGIEECDLSEGVSPLYAHLDFRLSEGPHLLFVRAVNAAGTIGQSLPVGIVGGQEQEPGQTLLAVTVEEGQSLDDVADSCGTDPATLHDLNPELGGQSPPAGTVIMVPAPPTMTRPAPDAPSVGPTTPPSPGTPPVAGAVPLAPDAPRLIPFLPGIVVTGTIRVLPQLVVPVFTPPAAPTDLLGSVESCMVRLRWSDNAWDELRYEVWMATPGSLPRLIASLQPGAGGAVWFEFPAPQTGDFSLWVEAVNSLGKQPSNIVSLYVGAECPSTPPTHLQVELLDMTVHGDEDRSYCYVSLENAPEARLPGDDSAFIQVQAGQGNIAAWAATDRRFLVPIPADGSLEITGECWGWARETLRKLGVFSHSTNSGQWTGARLPLAGASYELGYAVTYAEEAGGRGEETTYAFEDPTLPAPYNVRLVWETDAPYHVAKSVLHWSWEGNRPLTGFLFYWNDESVSYVSSPNARSTEVHLPSCDTEYHIRVVAVAGEARSRPGDLRHRTAACTAYVEVNFNSLILSEVNNYTFWNNDPDCAGVGSHDPCDDIGIWFDLWVNDQWTGEGNDQTQVSATCGNYDIPKFYSHGDASGRGTKVVPVSPSHPSVTVKGRFWYRDPWGDRRLFLSFSDTHTMEMDQWIRFHDWNAGPAMVCQEGVYSQLIYEIQGRTQP